MRNSRKVLLCIYVCLRHTNRHRKWNRRRGVNHIALLYRNYSVGLPVHRYPSPIHFLEYLSAYSQAPAPAPVHHLHKIDLSRCQMVFAYRWQLRELSKAFDSVVQRSHAQRLDQRLFWSFCCRLTFTLRSFKLLSLFALLVDVPVTIELTPTATPGRARGRSHHHRDGRD